MNASNSGFMVKICSLYIGVYNWVKCRISIEGQNQGKDLGFVSMVNIRAAI